MVPTLEPADLAADLPELIALCGRLELSVGTAESLTGGQLAATIVNVPGASAVLLGGIVAYQNSIKANVLGVSQDLLAESGAVDAEVAKQMALGACKVTGARVGLSTTGVAGPEPHQGKPVGNVFLGIACDGEAEAYEFNFVGDRTAIRDAAVVESLKHLRQLALRKS